MCFESYVTVKLFVCDSSRMVGLAQLLLTSDAANGLTEDYAACLESRLEESHAVESSSNDPGVLIMQVWALHFNGFDYFFFQFDGNLAFCSLAFVGFD